MQGSIGGGFALLASLTAGCDRGEKVSAPSDHATTADAVQLDRGRYAVRITGCNDCHTPGYTQAAGAVPEQNWLTGDALGWRGPWGTTYASNLRLYMQSISEDQWIEVARTARYRPPMPWFTLREISEQDLRAMYRFIHALGPAGEPAPVFLPPGEQPHGPYVQFPAPPEPGP
ncbi:MAG: c-type cytochrome [Chromatiales bacterium]